MNRLNKLCIDMGEQILYIHYQHYAFPWQKGENCFKNNVYHNILREKLKQFYAPDGFTDREDDLTMKSFNIVRWQNRTTTHKFLQIQPQLIPDTLASHFFLDQVQYPGSGKCWYKFVMHVWNLRDVNKENPLEYGEKLTVFLKWRKLDHFSGVFIAIFEQILLLVLVFL